MIIEITDEHIKDGQLDKDALALLGSDVVEIQGDKIKAKSFGAYLASLRAGLQLSLRAVEEAANKEVSNAYLSQLENGKIAKPSPDILFSLSEVYGVTYEQLMERAGYIAHGRNRADNQKNGSVATFSVDNLTAAEEAELLKYLGYYRNNRNKD